MSTTDAAARKGPSLLGLPRTIVGWWSVCLALAFIVLFALWQVYVRATPPRPRPTFFSDPLQAVLILGAATSAIAGAMVGLLALTLKRERSYLIWLSTLIGAFVLYWTIGEVMAG